MLTAVIRVDLSVEALAATFSVLIPAVAEGSLGHAVVLDSTGRSEIERLADATGATYLRADGDDGGWQRGAAEARGDWLLLLAAGDIPQAHWPQAVERHLLLSPDAPALLPLRGLAGSLRERAGLAFGPRTLRPGLVLPKRQVVAGRLDKAPRRLAVCRERATG